MRRLELTEIAGVRISSQSAANPAERGVRSDGPVHQGIRDTMKRLVAGTEVSRNRDDLGPGLQMATSGRHRIFFETDRSRVLVLRVLHDRMDYGRQLETGEPPDEER